MKSDDFNLLPKAKANEDNKEHQEENPVDQFLGTSQPSKAQAPTPEEGDFSLLPSSSPNSNPSLASRVAGAAEGVGKSLASPENLPFVGSGVHAYREGLTPLEEKVAAAPFALAGKLAGNPNYSLSRDVEMEREMLKSHPWVRAMAAMGVSAPLEVLSWIGAGKIAGSLTAGLAEKGLIKASQEAAASEATRAITTTDAEGAVQAAQRAAALARRTKLIEHTLQYGAFGATESARMQAEEQKFVPSSFLINPVVSIALGHALGIPLSKGAQRFLPFIKPEIQKLAEDSRFLPMLRDAQRVAGTLAKDHQLSKEAAGKLIYSVATGTGSEEERALIQQTLVRHPELAGSGFGGHLTTLVRAADQPKLIAGENLKPSDPISLIYEDQLRRERQVTLKSAREVTSFLKAEKEGTIRIIRATGPEEKLKLLSPLVERRKNVPLPHFEPITDEGLEKLFSKPSNALDKFFKDLPRLQPQESTSTELVASAQASKRTVAELKLKNAAEGITTGPRERRYGVTGREPVIEGEQHYPSGQHPSEQLDKTLSEAGYKPLPPPPPSPKPAPLKGEPKTSSPISRAYYGPETPAGRKIVDAQGKPLLADQAVEAPAILPTTLSPPPPDFLLLQGLDGLDQKIQASLVQSKISDPISDLRAPKDRQFFYQVVEAAKSGTLKPAQLSPRQARVVGSILDEYINKQFEQFLPHDLSRKLGLNSEHFTPLTKSEQEALASVESRPDIQHLIELSNGFAEQALPTIEESAPISLLRSSAGTLDIEKTKPKIAKVKARDLRRAYQAALEGKPTKVRGYTRDENSRRLPVTDNKDRSASIVTKGGIRVMVDLEDYPELVEAVQPLSDQDIAEAQATPESARPTPYGSFDRLQNQLSALDRRIAVETDPDELKHLRASRQEVLAALGNRLGKTSPSLPPPEKVPGLKKRGVRGFSKGELRTGGPTKLVGTISGIAKTLGHGDVYRMPDGRIRVETKAGVPLYFENEPQAVAGLLHIASRQAEIDEVHADINHQLSTGTLDPIPSPDAGPYWDPVLNFLTGISHESSLPSPRLTTKEGRVVGALQGSLREGNLGYFAMGRTVLRYMGEPGKNLEVLLQGYIDAKQRLYSLGDLAAKKLQEIAPEEQWKTRAIEYGSADRKMLEAYDQIAGRLNDQFYHDAQVAGAQMGKRIEGRRYVPHVFPLNTTLKALGLNISDSFLDEMVNNGVAQDRQDALQKLIETNGFNDTPDEAILDHMVQAINEKRQAKAASSGELFTPVNRAQAQQYLDELRQKAATIAYNLERERKGMPGYEDNLLKALRIAWRRNAASIAERTIFGSRLEHLNSLIDQIHREQGSTAAARAQEIVDLVRGRGIKSSIYDAVSNTAYNMARGFLSMSFLYHLPQNAFITERFGLKAHLKGIAARVGEDPERFIQYNAVVHRAWEGIADDPLEIASDLGIMSERAEKILKLSQKWGDFGSKPLELTINASRKVAFEVGQHVFDESLEALKSNPKDSKALGVLQELYGRKVTADQLLSMDPSTLDAARGIAGKRAAEWGLFEFNPLTMPLASAHPGFRFVMQFKNFLYSITATAFHELFGKGVPAARKTKAFLAIFGAYPAYGYLMARARNLLGASTRETKSVEQLTKKAHQHPDMWNVMKAYIAAWGLAHAVGIFNDFANAAYTGNTEMLRVFDMGVPAMGVFENVMSMMHSGVAGAYYEATGKKAMARYEAQKAAESAGRELGGAGQALAHFAVGVPKKPKKGKLGF